MKNNNFQFEEDILSEFLADTHLPLDWNENLSLEDYLEQLDKNK